MVLDVVLEVVLDAVVEVVVVFKEVDVSDNELIPWLRLKIDFSNEQTASCFDHFKNSLICL